MAYYLKLDGVDDKLLIPFPIGTKYVQMKIKRSNTSATGYLLDFRTSSNVTVYLAGSAATGYNSFSVDGASQTVGTSNVSQVPTDHIADVQVTLTSATTVSGKITLGGRYTGTSSADFLAFELHDIKLLDSSLNIIQAFNFIGSGTSLPSTTGAGDGTLQNGITWVDDGTGGTGTTYSASGTAQGVSSLSSSEKMILKASGTSQGNSSLSSSETYTPNLSNTYSATGTSQGLSILTSPEHLILKASGTAQGYSSLLSAETYSHPVLPQIYEESGTSIGYSMLTSNETFIKMVIPAKQLFASFIANNELNSAHTTENQLSVSFKAENKLAFQFKT